MGLVKVKMLCQTTYGGVPLSINKVYKVPKHVALRWSDKGIAKISSKPSKGTETNTEVETDENSLEDEDENILKEGE